MNSIKYIKLGIMILGLNSSFSLLGYVFVHGSESDMPEARILIFDKPNGKLVAEHNHVKRGNKGRRAEWSSKSIQQKLHLQPTDKLYFWIQAGGYKQGWIKADGIYGFVAQKQPKKNSSKELDKYEIIESSDAADEYQPAS